MPELFSRMDNLNWLTPSIAEILDQGSTPPGGDGSIRERMLTIQHELEELNTPARIVNVRSTPSYTLYIARPESVGRMGNRRTVTANEIKQSIKQIAESHKDWLLGFIPQLRDEDSAVGILLRTDEHRPMSLRRLLVRSTFRKHASTLAFVLGITLEQQLVVESIDEIGHMLVIGSDNAKQHFIRSTLLTLIMLNTPSELRVAIAGESSEAYKYLVGAPHALGRILTSPSEGQRLIDGLVKEIQRREQSLRDEKATSITDFNSRVTQSDKSKLPRIVLILDSLTDELWKKEVENWKQPLSKLLTRGANVGIHLIVIADDEANLSVPKSATDTFSLKIIMRASSKDISANIEDFHASLLRFVDAFVFTKIAKDSGDAMPVELCAISNSEIKNVVDYWRQMNKQRYQDLQAAKSSGTTGVTGVLSPRAELIPYNNTPPTPPTPQKPSAETLTRATQALGSGIATGTAVEEDTQIATTTSELSSYPERTQEMSSTSKSVNETLEAETIDSTIFGQATALSAYLGWISIGALCDILNVTQNEAREIIVQLQFHELIETADYPTLRFIRPE